MLELRPYQQDLKAQIVALIRQGHKRILVCLPTGGGKTTIFGDIVAGSSRKENGCLVVAHRKELIDQAHGRLHLFNVAAGRIMGGKHKYRGDRVNVASIQTLARREMPAAQVVIVDECHRATKSNQYGKLLTAYPNAIILGFTATPVRLDGRALGDFFQVMAQGVTVEELIGEGFLVPARYFRAHETINTDDLATDKKSGDYDAAQLFARADKPTLYQGVVTNWLRLANGLKTVVFCVNVEHSIKTAAAFSAHGIAAAHVDGTTPQKQRDQILADLTSGAITVVCNVGILTEGWDLPAIGCVILNRATASLGLFLQAVGRGLRPAPNKSHCIVLDMGGNTKRHGFAEDTRQWELNPKKKKPGAPPVKECKFPIPAHMANFPGELCGCLNRASATHCEECNAPFPKPKVEPPKQAVLVEVFPEHLKGRTWEQLNTVTEIEEFRKAKGYKLGWASHQLRALAARTDADMEVVFNEYADLRNFSTSWVYRELYASA